MTTKGDYFIIGCVVGGMLVLHGCAKTARVARRSTTGRARNFRDKARLNAQIAGLKVAHKAGQMRSAVTERQRQISAPWAIPRPALRERWRARRSRVDVEPLGQRAMDTLIADLHASGASDEDLRFFGVIQ
jgi:outer membrane murein-binding lipoprotein Lpp